MKILFVCTGNVFRSMSAEYCLKDYLKKNNITEHKVSSAGIVANPEKPHPETISTLNSLGIDVSNHKQTKLTKELLESADLIVAMADYHQKAIKEKFGFNSFLFDEIAIYEKSSILDDVDVVPNEKDHPGATGVFVTETTKFIHELTPDFIRHMKNFVK